MKQRGYGSEVINDDDSTPISAGRCRSNRVYASRPPAEPPTQTTGKSLATLLASIQKHSASIFTQVGALIIGRPDRAWSEVAA